MFPPAEYDVATEKDLVPLDQETYRKSVPVSGLLDPETRAPDVENGQYFWFGRNPLWHTKARDVFRYVTNGGGGWGDPMSREPDRVLRDVRDEYVTVDGAARNFGVVVVGDPHRDPEGCGSTRRPPRSCVPADRWATLRNVVPPVDNVAQLRLACAP